MTRTYFYDNLLTPSELEEKGIKAKKNTVYAKAHDGSVKTFKYSGKDPDGDGYIDAKQVKPSSLEKIANKTGLKITAIKNHIGSTIRHFKQGLKGVERKSKGGMVKGYSHGGSVSRGQSTAQARKVKFKGVF